METNNIRMIPIQLNACKRIFVEFTVSSFLLDFLQGAYAVEDGDEELYA